MVSVGTATRGGAHPRAQSGAPHIQHLSAIAIVGTVALLVIGLLVVYPVLILLFNSF
jgi:hypothetical protein